MYSFRYCFEYRYVYLDLFLFHVLLIHSPVFENFYNYWSLFHIQAYTVFSLHSKHDFCSLPSEYLHSSKQQSDIFNALWSTKQMCFLSAVTRSHAYLKLVYKR